MSFRVGEKVLERVEWPQLVERLRAHAQTPPGRARCAAAVHAGTEGANSLFEVEDGAARERLSETTEARALLDQGESPPLGGVPELDIPLRRLGKGGVLAARELLDLRAALAALRSTAQYMRRREALAPRLAGLAATIADFGTLEHDIERSIDEEGAVRDAASPALAAARAASRGLTAELQRRLDFYLRDPDIAGALSDRFVTLRNDRFVLPVRSDSRTRVRGIVHDASASGTTLFVEPEAVVELNNRLKHAELEVERETLRVLRDLSADAAAQLELLEAGLAALCALDLAFARGRLSLELGAVEPVVGQHGVLRLPQLRHPLLPRDGAVANDMALGETWRVLVLSGPNAGGKTVAMKAVALAVLAVRAGLHVCAAPGARVDLFAGLLADIGDEQSLRESLSTFSAHMANLARIVDEASPSTLVVLDEIGTGTDPGEGAALAQAILESLADSGARVVTTTHFNLLKEMAAVDSRFANASVEFDPDTLAPTYRLRLGVAGVSSATAVAARMGLRSDVLERANSLLEREDRRLDRMLAELADSRAALDREQREAARLRAESEAARAEYRDKLEKLQKRRDELFRAMREDLDRAFRGAHAEIAAVIRDLQRGGGAREAAHARDRLQAVAERAAVAAEEVGIAAAPQETLDPVDWRQARPGEAVRVHGHGPAVLVALPDRRGRVVVRVGSARLVVPMERVGAAPAAPPGATFRTRTPAHVEFEPTPATGLDVDALADGSDRCDLRGLRVEEALDRVVFALDRAAAAGRSRVVLVHGIGTGALRDAVRTQLRDSPYLAGFAPGGPEEGGDGVTIAKLAR